MLIDKTSGFDYEYTPSNSSEIDKIDTIMIKL